MVFWSKVTPAAADLAVLSLLGPQLERRERCSTRSDWTRCPPMTAAPLIDGGFVRRMSEARPGQIEFDVLVDRGDPRSCSAG